MSDFSNSWSSPGSVSKEHKQKLAEHVSRKEWIIHHCSRKEKLTYPFNVKDVLFMAVCQMVSIPVIYLYHAGEFRLKQKEKNNNKGSLLTFSYWESKAHLLEEAHVKKQSGDKESKKIIKQRKKFHSPLFC